MMDFSIRFQPPPLPEKIMHQQKILLAGSCFTEHIGQYLSDLKFDLLVNPNGIVFNPISIVTAITSWIENKVYEENELIAHNGRWHSPDHHSRFSHTNKATTLSGINKAIQAAHHFLKETDWLIVTLGSAFVYEWTDRENHVVANCHKLPANRFHKRLLTTEEIIAAFGNLFYRLQLAQPTLKIIFTISPVRHIRDGVIENNLSKATLIQAVHHLVNKFDHLYYFPAYEIVIDELRDYRFYAADMVHPNETAIRYVAEKFLSTCIHPQVYPLVKELEKINAAVNHRPFDIDAPAHQQFQEVQLSKIDALQQTYPYINFDKEIASFSQKKNPL